MTPAGTVAHMGRTPDDFGLKFKSNDFNGGWASYDVRKEHGTFKNLYTNRPIPVRTPAEVL